MMANLFNLLRKKKIDQYNQAMQSSPFLPDYYGNPGAHWGEQDSRKAQLLLANPDDLSLDAQVAKVHGPSAQFSEAFYRQGPKHKSNLVGERGVYDLNRPDLSTMYTDKPLTGTDTIYKDRKDGKGQDYEGMMEALLEHESAKPAGWASMGKPGGTGGGGFKLFPNSMVDDMASSGPLNLEQQKEDWWKRYLRSIA